MIRVTRRMLGIAALCGMVTMWNAGAMTVVSQGGGPVPIPPNFKGALVADPDNFFLTPFEPASAAGDAPVPPAATAGQAPSR